MRTAVAGGDYQALATAAHTLKGSGGTVGFDAFTEPAAHLEACANARDPLGCGAAVDVLEDLMRRIELPQELQPHAASG
jgi:HPt (histidine-containing phosphotransfer) domain-containing protein